MAYVTKYDLQMMIGLLIPLRMITDSLSLFDVLTKASTTTEKRLKIDLQTVQNSYDKSEIQDVAFIRSEYNIADVLTKMKKKKGLMQAINTSVLGHPIQQWIIQKTGSDSVV